MYVLGIDGGGTKTVCVIMDENSHVISRGESGAANYHSVGKNTAFSSIQEAIKQAVKPLGKIEIRAIGFGLAGVARPRDFQVVQGWVDKLSKSGSLNLLWKKCSNYIVHHDAYTALVGGIGKAEGIVVNAGTGSIIFGCNHQGETKRVGGWGYLLGDETSGYGIALKGIQAALKAYDGLGDSTSLLQDFPSHLGLESIQDLVEAIYQQKWSASKIAALASLVDAAAVRGDKIAKKIITEAIAALVKDTQVVSQTLFADSHQVEIVTTGSVWKCAYPFRQQFEASLSKLLPNSQVIYPRHEPAFGAAWLALQTLGELSKS